MDGDRAPLEEIIELARLHGARVAVDEAHAIGTCGPGGRGLLAQAGLEGEVDVIIGTLGKALASYGAFACADGEMIRYLINTARSLIFSTAPPPAAVAGSLAALELLQERPHRVQRLCSNARVLRRALAAEGFPVLDGETHIVALIVGEERAAMQLCQEALERGVFAQAIRPPAVPAGTARLRLAAMSSHTVSELRMAAGALGDAARAIGLDPARFGPSLAECEPVFAGPAVADSALAEPAFAESTFAEPTFAESTFAGYDDEIPLSAAPEPPPTVFDHERLAEPDEGIPASPAPELPRPVFDYERDASAVRAA
jgi:glycine C-acetyltransferase/8-amino-7-oxononanoate synthase